MLFEIERRILEAAMQEHADEILEEKFTSESHIRKVFSELCRTKEMGKPIRAVDIQRETSLSPAHIRGAVRLLRRMGVFVCRKLSGKDRGYYISADDIDETIADLESRARSMQLTANQLKLSKLAQSDRIAELEAQMAADQQETLTL